MNKSLVQKVTIIALLMFGMYIGLQLVDGVIQDRLSHRNTARHSIITAWAGQQEVIGPLLIVPEAKTVEKKVHNPYLRAEESITETISVLQYYTPKTLRVNADISTEQRYRGIHSFPVYTTELVAQGIFTIPPLIAAIETKEQFISLQLGLSDARGFTGDALLRWGDAEIELIPGTANTLPFSGLHARLPLSSLKEGEQIPFELRFTIKGMQSLQIAALGQQSDISISGQWPHPKFIGNFLPNSRDISEVRFAADWNLSGFATGVGNRLSDCSENACYLANQFVGVDIFDPLNLYHITHRSLKYGLLFISLTFFSFLLFELLKQLPIHPIQYTFVGMMQAVFYLVLLSLSEHISFTLAYVLATCACVIVLSFYLSVVLGSRSRGLSYGATFAALYCALYFVLLSADYALLLGTTLLFGILSATMLGTRKINWYALQDKSRAVASPAASSTAS